VLGRVLDFEMPTSAIIFCRTKSEVDSLGERLTARAYPAETLHGDLSQIQRDRVMGRFKTGQVELLVATDVAARGLDIDLVSHVINYDMPLDPEVYVHRVGRTGRAGRTGSAITLVTPRERRMLRAIERMTGAEIRRMRLPTIADVIARRRESFKETLRETIQGDGLEPYMIMAEELGEEYSPTDLAAAAFKLLLDQSLIETDDPLAQDDERYEEERGGWRGRRRDGGGGRGDRNFGPGQDMTRLYIDVGREDNVRPADIVGAIANEAGIPGRAIGAIELFDHFALVDVPATQAEKVLRALKRTTIRGRKISPTVAKPKR
jgi:ATP-dependent RNA helicase DeaD